MVRRQRATAIPPEVQQQIRDWAGAAENFGQFLTAFDSKQRARALERNPDTPDFTEFQVAKGNVRKMWDAAQAGQPRASGKKAKQAKRVRRPKADPAKLAQRYELPEILDEGDPRTIDAPTLKEVGDTVRDNLEVKLFERGRRANEALVSANYEFVKHDFRLVGMEPPTIESAFKRVWKKVEKDHVRAFLIRYTGPELVAAGPQGTVLLKEGNVVGFHIQRTTFSWKNDFLGGLIPLRGTVPEGNDGMLKMFYERFIQPIRKAHPDLFKYHAMCELDETREQGMFKAGEPRDKSIYLMDINILPALGGIGLSTPALRQALAHDLDREGVEFVFGFARMAELYGGYVPADEQLKFLRLRRESFITEVIEGGDVPKRDLQYIAESSATGGVVELQKNVLRKRADGLSEFATLRFHERAGANVICGIPACTSDDVESLIAGVLVIYDLAKLREAGRI